MTNGSNYIYSRYGNVKTFLSTIEAFTLMLLLLISYEMALVYSCCFWFSLRLGGILIGTFSIMNAITILFFCSCWYSRPTNIRDICSVWLSDINLIYTRDIIESLHADPKKGLGIIIIMTSLYIILSLLYVYGAYKRNNVAMIAYIVVELIRLIGLFVLVTTLLLMLKQNTMDIGLLIGASVIGGFVLLGSLYLWVCAANLPILINEKEHYDQVIVIEKLQQLLQENKSKDIVAFDNDPRMKYNEDPYRNHIYTILRNKTMK